MARLEVSGYAETWHPYYWVPQSGHNCGKMCVIHFFIFVVYVGEIIFEPFSCECGVLGGETWQYLVLTMNESYKLWQSFSLFDQRMLILPSLLWYFLWWKLLQFSIFILSDFQIISNFNCCPNTFSDRYYIYSFLPYVLYMCYVLIFLFNHFLSHGLHFDIS